MRNMRDQGRKSAKSSLRHFTISYFMILLIPIVMGVLAYKNTLEIATQQTLYSNRLILKNSMETLEKSLHAIKDYSETLNQLTLFDKVINARGKENVDLLELQKAAKNFPEFSDPNQYVESFFLYITNNQLLLAPKRALINIERYYGSYFDFGSLSYMEWVSWVRENPSGNSRLYSLASGQGDDEQHQLIYRLPYYTKISYNKPSEVITGNLFFILNEEQVEKTLSPAFDLGAGFMYILDDKGEFLISMEQTGYAAQKIDNEELTVSEGTLEKRIDGKMMNISYLKSNVYGWTYVIAIPREHLLKTVRGNLGLTVLSTALVAFFGALVVFAAFKYNQRPLLSILGKMNSQAFPSKYESRSQQVKNGLWNLSNNISVLVSSNYNLEAKVEQQKKQLREAFFIQLVSGQLLDEDNLSLHLEDFGLNTANRRFRGVYMKCSPEEGTDYEKEKGLVEAVLGSAHMEEGRRLFPCFWPDPGHLTLLYSEDEAQTGSSMQNHLREIYFQMKDTCRVETVFFIGSEYAALQEVHLSFSEARSMMINQKSASASIFYLNEYNARDGSNFRYSTQEEVKLLEYAGLGRFEEIRAILNTVYENNFAINPVSYYMRELLIYRMIGTLANSPWDISLIKSRPACTAMSTEEFFTLLLQQYEVICQKNLLTIQQKQEKIENEIIRYINSHYMENNLCMKTLSMHFGMTESYLSVFIKQLIGETFSSYLENLRIREANRLLQDPRLSITEISALVGYDSSTSFGRAYKRVMGYSASQYRKFNESQSLT